MGESPEWQMVSVTIQLLSIISSIIIPCSLNRKGLHCVTITSSNITAKQSPPASILIIALKMWQERIWQRIMTIPIKCSDTKFLPDLCLFKKACKKLVIIELTVAFELNNQQAHGEKNLTNTLLLSRVSKVRALNVILLVFKLGSEVLYLLISNSVWNPFSNCNNPVTFKKRQWS